MIVWLTKTIIRAFNNLLPLNNGYKVPYAMKSWFFLQRELDLLPYKEVFWIDRSLAGFRE